jgi:hypothetical protein
MGSNESRASGNQNLAFHVMGIRSNRIEKSDLQTEVHWFPAKTSASPKLNNPWLNLRSFCIEAIEA